MLAFFANLLLFGLRSTVWFIVQTVTRCTMHPTALMSLCTDQLKLELESLFVDLATSQPTWL